MRHGRQSGKRLDLAAGPGAKAPLLADADGDSRLDLVVADVATGCVSVLRGAGTGFDPAASFGVGLDPSSIARLDFDADGRVDLVVAARGADVLSLHRNLSAR